MKPNSKILSIIFVVGLLLCRSNTITASTAANTTLQQIDLATQMAIRLVQENKFELLRTLIRKIKIETLQLKKVLETNTFNPPAFSQSLWLIEKIGTKCKRHGGFLYEVYVDLNTTICCALSQKLRSENLYSKLIAQSISNLFWNFNSFQVLKDFFWHLKGQDCQIDRVVLEFILDFVMSKFKNGFCTEGQSNFAKTVTLQEIIEELQQYYDKETATFLCCKIEL